MQTLNFQSQKIKLESSLHLIKNSYLFDLWFCKCIDAKNLSIPYALVDTLSVAAAAGINIGPKVLLGLVQVISLSNVADI